MSETRGKDNKSSLAHRAQQKYNAGKYIECIDALQKLSEEIAPERDVKVQHNLVIAGYVSHKYTTRELEQHLRNLLATLTEQDTHEPSKRTSTEEIMICAFVRYNLAASLFQQKQYAAASTVLDVLVRNIEPMEENVAMHVCFLYLDIILHSSRACISTERERQVAIKKAQSILMYLEKPHGFNGQGMTSNTSHTNEEKTIETSTSVEHKREDGDVIEFRFRLHLYKAKLWLLQSNLKIAKKEVKSALEIFQKEIRSRTDDVGSTEKTSTSIGHPSLAVQKTTGLFLKANLEYLRANHKKCIKLLASCVQQAVDESIFLNNMGCIHFQMGQRKAAHSYFARALEASLKTKKSTQESAVVLTTSSQYEIMYNNGLQLLLQGDYVLAFRCFHVSSRMFFNRPKLWLRMGECCTAAFAQQTRLATTVGNKSGLIQGIIGGGSHRRVLLPTTQLHSGVEDIEIPDKHGRTNGNNGSASSSTASGLNGVPKMNLPFAAKCFKNVILLCHQLMESAKETTSETTENDKESTEALDLLRQKAFVNLSYVYLSMYEPQLAITNAKELLRIPSCTKSNRFLARSYGAEALCMLSRAQEATQVLQAERDMMNLAEEYSKEAKSNPKQARAAVHVNNATSLILHGKVGEAEESVSRAVSENSSCRESLKLLVYFYLKKGDTKKALRVLKEAQVAV